MDLSAKLIDPFWNWWQKTGLKIQNFKSKKLKTTVRVRKGNLMFLFVNQDFQEQIKIQLLLLELTEEILSQKS